jgi:hypothetical protein
MCPPPALSLVQATIHEHGKDLAMYACHHSSATISSSGVTWQPTLRRSTASDKAGTLAASSYTSGKEPAWPCRCG